MMENILILKPRRIQQYYFFRVKKDTSTQNSLLKNKITVHLIKIDNIIGESTDF